ncbi:MAG: leucyl/phenylalanyl-tRNA--protein transferase [Sphingomicrobium sp.]
MTLDPAILLRGYAAGIFPMADSREANELYWVEPNERAVIPLDGFHLSRSLNRTLRSGRFSVTRDTAFAEVVTHCAERAETWINRDIETAVLALHRAGHAHSVEIWSGDRLAGGLYGVKIGGAFFGESMFSRDRDASKVALAWLVARLRAGHFRLLDCQIMTDHLQSLGAIGISKADYAVLLSAAIGPAGSGAGSGAAEAVGAAPAFGALDVLLEAAERGAEPGAGSPAGKVISQLLTQTS